jgi:hypothetical protein
MEYGHETKASKSHRSERREREKEMRVCPIFSRHIVYLPLYASTKPYRKIRKSVSEKRKYIQKRRRFHTY